VGVSLKPVSFGIIGGGFRTGCFLRIAQALPDRFQVCGMIVRNEERGNELEQAWQVKTYRTLKQFLVDHHPDFMVLSVHPKASPQYLFELTDLGIPVLSETPPAADFEDLVALAELIRCKARIQVAEQYHYRPMNAARLKIVESGDLGPITQASVSISHGYHGMNLLRKMLDVGFESVKIRAMRFESPMVAGPSRSGLPKEEAMILSKRDIAWIQFGDKLGIYDFTNDQHRSWIRDTHISVRGVRGEISDKRVNLLLDYKTPLHMELQRVNRGEEENVEGYFMSGIILGNRWIYHNPYVGAPLNDDEIAVATCLDNMASYSRGGDDFYSLRDASQDHYLAMLLEQSIRTGEEITSEVQPWHG